MLWRRFCFFLFHDARARERGREGGDGRGRLSLVGRREKIRYFYLFIFFSPSFILSYPSKVGDRVPEPGVDSRRRCGAAAGEIKRV